MKETIYTIPINEAFAEKRGCPLCRLARKTEEKTLDYILGAAMMEPDVRQETNRLGFCAPHYAVMRGMGNRLSLALTLESRLKTVADTNAAVADRASAGKPDEKQAQALSRTAESCFVCTHVEQVMGHYYRNLMHMWRSEEEFRQSFSDQPYFCLPHYARLLEYAQAAYPRRLAAEFIRVLAGVQGRRLDALREAVGGFCRSFDYRHAGEPFDREAVEKAVAFLSGDIPEA